MNPSIKTLWIIGQFELIEFTGTLGYDPSYFIIDRMTGESTFICWKVK